MTNTLPLDQALANANSATYSSPGEKAAVLSSLNNAYSSGKTVATPVAPASSATPASTGITDYAQYSQPKTQDQTDLETATTALSSAKSDAGVPNENDRSSATAMFQKEIDALNQVYAQQKSAETIAGNNRLGSSAAIQARRGLLGSDFGAAATDNQVSANTEAQNAIDSKHNVDLGAIFGKISQAAVDMASKRVSAATAGAQAKIDEIKGRQTDAHSAVADAVKAYLADGKNDGTKLTMKDAQDWADTFKKQGFNVNVNDIANTVKDTVAANNKAKADANVEAHKGDYTVGNNRYSADGTLISSTPLDPLESKLKQAQIAKIYSDMAASSTGDASAAASWSANIKSGQAKLSDVPKNLKDSVSKLLAAGSSSTGEMLSTTKNSLSELQTMVDNNNGFGGAVGAKGFSSFFGLKSKPIAGTAAADFDAKLNQVKNDVVLPNLNLLHGLGRVTDREFQALTAAVTSLNTDTSEEAFKTELKNITDTINKKITETGYSSDLNSSGVLKSPDGTQQVNVSELTPAQIKEAKTAGWL